MVFKDILVHIDDQEARTVRLEVAIALAKAHHARLTGFYVKHFPTATTYGHLPVSFLDSIDETVRERARDAQDVFSQATAAAELSTQWRCVEAAPAFLAVNQLRFADLLVLGHNPRSRLITDEADLENTLLLDTGCPALVVPSACAARPIGKKVLVAWNASRPSLRAVNDALPILLRAEEVRVLSVNERNARHGEADIPSADLCAHLIHHGVQVQEVDLQANEKEIGEVLLYQVGDNDVDLMVMGAYGHSRVRELIMGGVTRHVLKHASVPLLMSH